MKRLARRLCTICSAASLLLCVAFGALWLRSYFVLDALASGWVNDPPTSGSYLQAYSNRGAISLRRFDVAVVGMAPADYHVGDGLHIDVGQDERWTRSDPSPWGRARFDYLLGFSHHDGAYLRRPTPDVRQMERDRGMTFPHWLPLLGAAIVPALRFRKARRARLRPRSGLCLRCGYDLRASPDRCPECGTG